MGFFSWVSAPQILQPSAAYTRLRWASFNHHPIYIKRHPSVDQNPLISITYPRLSVYFRFANLWQGHRNRIEPNTAGSLQSPPPWKQTPPLGYAPPHHPHPTPPHTHPTLSKQHSSRPSYPRRYSLQWPGLYDESSPEGVGRSVKRPKSANERILWLWKSHKTFPVFVIYSYLKDNAFTVVERDTKF